MLQTQRQAITAAPMRKQEFYNTVRFAVELFRFTLDWVFVLLFLPITLFHFCPPLTSFYNLRDMVMDIQSLVTIYGQFAKKRKNNILNKKFETDLCTIRKKNTKHLPLCSTFC